MLQIHSCRSRWNQPKSIDTSRSSICRGSVLWCFLSIFSAYICVCMCLCVCMWNYHMSGGQILTTRGQSGWSPIGCVCFHAMCKNMVSVRGWSSIDCEILWGFSNKFEHAKSTPYYFSFPLILSVAHMEIKLSLLIHLHSPSCLLSFMKPNVYIRSTGQGPSGNCAVDGQRRHSSLFLGNVGAHISFSWRHMCTIFWYTLCTQFWPCF